MTDAEARCPDCNTPLAPGAELCPECGTIIAETNAPAEAMDLGIELVQGSGYSENEFMPSPEAAAVTEPPVPTSQEPAIPVEPLAPVTPAPRPVTPAPPPVTPAPLPVAPPPPPVAPSPPPQAPATAIEPAIPEIAESPEPQDSGLQFESMTDPAALAEAAAAAALEAEELVLESLIPTADAPVETTPPVEDIHTAATVKTPAQPAPEEDLLDLDLDMEVVEPAAAASAPPPTRAEPAIEAPPPPPPAPRTQQADTRPTPISIPTEAIPDEALPSEVTGGKTPASEAKEDKAALFKNRAPANKKVGGIGILLRLVLVLVLGAATWFVAGAPGADTLRDMGIPVPGGTERLRYITNNLAEPIQIRADNDPYAVADAGVRLAVPERAGSPLTWHLVQPPQSGGLMAGEDFSAELVEFTVEGEDEYYEVTYQSVEYWMFTPLVTNPTNTPMTAIINAGTTRATPCDCIIPPGAQSHHIGYYPFEAGIDIRFYDANNFDANRYREVRDVTTSVAEGSGAVEVRIPRR